jgi:hypothetical protein
VRDAGVVDKHGEFFAGTYIGNCLHTGVGAEVGDQGMNLDVRKRRNEFLEPIAAAAHDHEIGSLRTEPSGKGLADAGGVRCVL